MCGIAGVSHLTDITRTMLPFLAWDIESRGHDSWGATNGRDTEKALGPITSTLYDHLDYILEWDRVILHTRAASTGEVTLANQHPFHNVVKDGDGTIIREVMGIHNGIVANHFALNTQYSRTNEVDSMHIYQHIAEERDTGEIHGWGNLAWYTYDTDHPDGALRLLRFNHTDLHVALLVTGEIVFCSTKDTIVRAAAVAGSDVKKFLPTSDETVYRVGKDRNGDWQLFQRDVKMKFGVRHSYQNFHPMHGGNGGRNFDEYTPGLRKVGPELNLSTLQHEDRKNNICLINGCTEKVTPNRRQALICAKDWAKLVEDEATYGVKV